MTKILDILNEIASDNGGNHKKAVFTKHKNNELFKRACFLAYDPKIQFYQRKIPIYTPADSKGAHAHLDNALNQLIALTTREKTGHEAIAHLKLILEAVHPDDATVIERVVLKDFKVGASEGTISKTWPGLLSEYPIALSSAFKYALLEKLIAKPGKKFAQLKSDGARTPIHISPVGVVQIFTRQGREVNVGGRFDWLGEIEALRGHVIDGEMLARDPVTGKPMPRKTGNGLVNKAVKGTLPEAEMDILYLTAWDVIELDEFEAGKGTKKYEHRLEKMKWFVSYMHLMYPKANLELIDSEEIETVEDAIRVGERYLAMGLEGAMIKHGDMVWEDSRSKLSIKIKGERECDLRVARVEPGQGKYTGMIGALYSESADGMVGVSVGGGLTDEDRAQDPEYWLDSIIGVLYNEKIKAKKRKPGEPEYSLFLPRLHPEKRKRIDKTVADIIDNIP